MNPVQQSCDTARQSRDTSPATSQKSCDMSRNTSLDLEEEMLSIKSLPVSYKMTADSSPPAVTRPRLSNKYFKSPSKLRSPSPLTKFAQSPPKVTRIVMRSPPSAQPLSVSPRGRSGGFHRPLEPTHVVSALDKASIEVGLSVSAIYPITLITRTGRQ